MEKTNLEIAIDWIYAHVKPEARSLLTYRFGPQKTDYGAHVYISYTAVFFAYQGLEFSTRAAILAESPRQAEYVLLDLRREIGVPIDFEYYQAPGVAPEAVDPVGNEWPEKSAEFGRTCYRVGNQAISQIYDGMAFDSPSKGLVTAKSGRSWWSPYWFWVKV